MAQVFDTGLATPQRTAIRNAIIAKLAPLKKTANPALYIADKGIKTLPRPYRGVGDTEGKEMLAIELQGQAPAIAIAIGRLVYAERGVSAVEAGGQLEVVVYAVSAHEKGLVEGRLYGDAIAALSNSNDPGVFVILEHCRQLLLGQELGIDGVGPMRPHGEDEAATFSDFTVWEQRYTVDVDVEINPQRFITQLVESIEARHKLDGIPGGHALDPLITTITELEP